MDKSPSFWRRTPPVLFPNCLGLLGLALAWREAEIDGVAIGLQLVAVITFLFVYICYLAKVVARPAVVFDDLRIAPARGAVSAGSMCWMLVAAIIAPFMIEVARVVWWAALALHAFYLFCVIRSLAASKDPLTSVSPVLLLPFVGYIVAAVSGGSLGYEALSRSFILVSIPIVLLILLLSFINALKGRVALPDRVSFAIALAPVSIYAIAAHDVMDVSAFQTFVVFSIAAFITLLIASRWMLSGGWKPSWAALTFPSAAFASAMITASNSGLVPSTLSWAALIFASLVIPFVLWRTCQMWMTGRLAEVTKSAVA